MEYLLDFFSPITLLGIKIAIISIFADSLFAYALALKNGNFNMKIVPQFLIRNLLPYLVALIVTAIIAELDSDCMPLFVIATAGITAKFGYEAIKEKLIQILK